MTAVAFALLCCVALELFRRLGPQVPALSPIAQRVPIHPMFLYMFVLGAVCMHLLPVVWMVILACCVGIACVVQPQRVTRNMVIGLGSGAFADLLPFSGVPGILLGLIVVVGVCLFIRPLPDANRPVETSP